MHFQSLLKSGASSLRLADGMIGTKAANDRGEAVPTAARRDVAAPSVGAEPRPSGTT